MKFTGPLPPMKARLIRMHLILIPVYIWMFLAWAAFAIDISPAGQFDRSGHIKGHDFAHFYVLGEVANDHATDDLYSFEAQGLRMDRLVPTYENRFVPIHGPQLSLLFAPLARLPYETALTIWLAFTAAGYAACCYLLWASAPALRQYRWVAVTLAIGYPPFFLLIAFGQRSVLALLCVTVAYFAMRAKRPWLAGFALGSLFYKPSFGVALPFVLLYGREWRMLLGAVAAVALQLAVGAAYFGIAVLGRYFETVTRLGQVADLLEPQLYQMQSLRSFFSVLVPWPDLAFFAYLLSAAVVVGLAAVCWRTPASLELRYSVLLLATVLVDPHVNPYDLVAITPVFFLMADWAVSRGWSGWLMWTLLGLSYYLPAMSHLTLLTHVQVSVLALVGLTVLLTRLAYERRPQLPNAV